MKIERPRDSGRAAPLLLARDDAFSDPHSMTSVSVGSTPPLGVFPQTATNCVLNGISASAAAPRHLRIASLAFFTSPPVARSTSKARTASALSSFTEELRVPAAWSLPK